VLGHLERGTTDAAARPSTLPVARYIDPEGYERERTGLFRELPLVVGHASQLAAPGDFLTHDASGVPLLVVRGEDGKLAAFLNVCRHRGARLEAAPCGRREAFVCPYHAWSYAHDGRVLEIPQPDGFTGIDRETRRLVPLPVGERAGLVFVRPVPGGEVSLDAELASWLGPIAADLEGFFVPAAHVHAPTTIVKRLSWKLAIDVFLESYHLSAAHLVDVIGAHQRHVFPRRTIRELQNRPEAEWELRCHASILFHLFPNTLILIEPGHAAVLHMWPQGPARTVLTAYTLLAEPPVNEAERAYWAASNAVLYGAIEDDFARGESIQLGLSSGANREVVFGTFEHALAQFHAEIDRRGGGGAPEPIPQLDRSTARMTAQLPLGVAAAGHGGSHAGTAAELRALYDAAQRASSTRRPIS
jgi:phenylpropionate dioxygenase-like ring-hydroxylating dioxygenase large terminal subunit